MRFHHPEPHDEPEINLIPLIDVLLVLLIFLTATTTFSRYTELAVNLPQAAAQEPAPPEIAIDVSADGRYAVVGQAIDAAQLAAALTQAASGLNDPLLVIYADAQASHQSVIDVMQAARAAGLARLSFAARRGQGN